MYEHLLVALDGSKAAEHVLPHAESLAKAFGSRITLLSASIAAETLLAQSATSGSPGVGDVAPPMDPTPILEAEQQAAAEYLAKVEAQLRAQGLNVDSEHPEGDAADLIVQRANELGVTLILMTTHGRSGLARAVFGSVADAVLRHASCAVLLVRITDRAEDRS
jgi:nucleotide-binding universal stress UspA family protein